MRPSLLDPLFAALTTLPGVGPKLEKLYRRLFGREETPARVIDLLFHLPTGTIDRRARPKLRDVVPGTVATVAVTVDRHRPPPPNRPRAPYRIYAERRDRRRSRSPISTRKRDYLEKLLPVGELRYVSGTTALYDGMLQMVHPDRVVDEAELDKLPLVEPVYPLTEGLTPQPGAQGRRGGARRACPTLPEWQDAAWLRRAELSGLRRRAAQRCITRPSPRDVAAGERRPGRGSPMTSCSPASSRSRWCARTMRRLPGRAQRRRRAASRAKIVAALPYSLTPSQARARRRDRRRSRAAASACCGCCRATSAPARPWWRCSPPRP